MNAVIALVAAIGFAFALLVHLATYADVDVEAATSWVWALHGGIFVLYPLFAVSSGRRFRTRSFRKVLVGAFPPWARVLLAAALVYTVVNFMLFLGAGEGGTPTIRDGRYLLVDHGTVLRELTAAEYRHIRAAILRGYSGHWVFLYLFPTLYFLSAARQQRRPA